MNVNDIESVKALTFDLFGTILDLRGSVEPTVVEFLREHDGEGLLDDFMDRWRYRQRIEQYQDTLLMMGYSGYLETDRRALVYTLRRLRLPSDDETVKRLMQPWQFLSPFPDVLPALARMKDRFELVVLSNGEPDYLDHLVQNRLQWNFDNVVSVETVGAFKPHPGVYRKAAQMLGLLLSECLMVSSNSFDVMGARTCGMCAAYVNRYRLPYEDTPFQPDLEIRDFTEMADALL